MENIEEYQDLLLKFDVLLLDHMFEKFGSAYLGYYRLDHGHYFSSSRLILDALLKITDFVLEFILTCISLLKKGERLYLLKPIISE